MFYDVYKRLCDEHGVDPYAVPLKIGYKSNSVVAQWASGSVPRGKYLDKLAEFFGVSVTFLMDMEQTKKAPPYDVESEAELISLFRQLNSEGRAMALSLLRGMVLTGEYKKRDANSMGA